jgi:hypothetical protein
MATATTQLPSTKKQPTYAELQAQYEKLQQELATAQANAKSPATLTWKTSSKGGLILYGMQRFPVTLKAEQWERLVTMATDGTITAAIADHRAGKLPVKQVVESVEK